MAIYRDPILEAVNAKLNAEGPVELQNKYFTGDPLIINKSRLPAVFMTRDRTQIKDLDIATDEQTMSVVLDVVQDLTRDFNQAFDQLNSNVTLYKWIEGRNSDLTLTSNSILYILRKYQQQKLNQNLWINMSTPVDADYGVTLNKRGNGMFSVEAVVKFTLTFIQPFPGNP